MSKPIAAREDSRGIICPKAAVGSVATTSYPSIILNVKNLQIQVMSRP
jgi:hypothetical protein